MNALLERTVTVSAFGQDPINLRFPQPTDRLDQDEEWCEFRAAEAEEWRRVRFHDYAEIYSVPGLYESLFYRALRCTSPTRVASMLDEVLSEHSENFDHLRVLDVGAGNGMVGEQLRNLGAAEVVGIDLLPEAREATLRDRAFVYDDYFADDLTDLSAEATKYLDRQQLNTMTCVAALGFGDIPPLAFVNAVNQIEAEGWLAFNIKEQFLYESDYTGFASLIDALRRRRVIRIERFERYCHRLSATGRPLHYVGVVARKLRHVPDDVVEAAT